MTDRLRKPNNHVTKWCIIHWCDIHIKFNMKVNELVRRPLRGPQMHMNPKPETCTSLQNNYSVLKISPFTVQTFQYTFKFKRSAGNVSACTSNSLAYVQSFGMLSVYWPTGLCAISINKLPILMLAVFPSEGSFHVAIINWQLQIRQ